jgi:ATP-dependent Clp endopeptidase proteolytic subunit ClpP
VIDKIKKLVDILSTNETNKEEPIVISAEEQEQILHELLGAPPKEPDLRLIGLFSEVVDEKVAELVHAMLYLDEANRVREEEKPIGFYVCTYGGSADDMFALYDVMRQVRETTEIHTVGMGKVMSAGVLILAAGTKGQRKIGKYCRVMIHSVIGGSHGSLPNLANEMEAMQQIQKDYIEALVAETNMSKKDLKKLLERKVNVYLSAEEAVELGIADIII